MKTVIVFLSLFLAGTGAFSQTPGWLIDFLRSKGLDKKYEPAAYMKPSFLQADLNGDGSADIAVLVVEKASHKKGVLLIAGKSPSYFVVGAGTNFGNGSDDFSWAGQWSVYNGKSAYETQFDKKSGDVTGGKKIPLTRPCISIMSVEDGAAIAGGLIYWTGTKFRWIQQGE